MLSSSDETVPTVGRGLVKTFYIIQAKVVVLLVQWFFGFLVLLLIQLRVFRINSHASGHNSTMRREFRIRWKEFKRNYYFTNLKVCLKHSKGMWSACLVLNSEVKRLVICKLVLVLWIYCVEILQWRQMRRVRKKNIWPSIFSFIATR